MHLVHQSHTNRYLNVNKAAFQIIPRTPIEIERRWDRFFDCFCHSFWTQFAISHSNNLMKKKRQNTLKTTEYNIQLEHTRAQNTSTKYEHVAHQLNCAPFSICYRLRFVFLWNFQSTSFDQNLKLNSRNKISSVDWIAHQCQSWFIPFDIDEKLVNVLSGNCTRYTTDREKRVCTCTHSL